MEDNLQGPASMDVEALADALAERLHVAEASPWMNTAEAADYMRVSVRWLRQHMQEVPHSKVRGRLFFRRSQLDAWLGRNRRN